MNTIPFVDFKRMHDPIRAQLHAAARRVIDSGKYIGGAEVKDFEAEMAAREGVPEVCGVACATSGLFATLKCMGVGVGDEVITTDHTAIATVESISLTGAQPVLCDLHRDYFFLDPAEVARKVSSRTKAIIPVHLYGQPVDMDALLELARQKDLRVIEDCAQAQGAYYKGRRVGTLGDAAVFSFFPSKNLGGFGDGGAVHARDPGLLKRIRMFSNHGRLDKYVHEFEGFNSRLDALQAALLRVILTQLTDWNRARRQAAAWYAEELKGISELILPRELPGTEPVYHVYAVLAPDREKLQKHLKEQKIESGLHYPYALNVLPAYAYMNQGKGRFPRAEYVCEHELSLPMHPAITREEVVAIGAALRKFFA